MAAAGSESDPLRTWGILLRRLDSLLAGLVLSADERSQISWDVKSRRYVAGQTIIKAGECGGYWGLVVRGQVAVLAPTTRWGFLRPTHAEPVAPFLPGAAFGEGMLLDGEASPYTLRAVSDVEIYTLSRADVMAVVGAGRLPSARKPNRASRRWAAMALVLLAILVGSAAYWGATLIAGHRLTSSASAGPGDSAARGGIVQILVPVSGLVLQRSSPTIVRAQISSPDLFRARLEVDGKTVASQVTLPQGSTPWVAEWNWTAAEDGSHILTVEADAADGGIVPSKPISVVVVPPGELVFSSNRGGSEAIYRMRTDGSNVQLVTVGPGACDQPAVDMQGDLAFVSQQGATGTLIRWLPTGLGTPEDLLPGREPSWSFDGKQVAFSADISDTSQVFVLSLPSRKVVQVTREEVYGGQPTWSPKGNSIAFVAEHARNLDIWVTDASTGKALRITTDPATDWAPAWSPDGSLLAFVSNRSGTHQIYVMRPDGTGVRQLTSLPQGAESPSWSPDGYWLAYVAYTGEGFGVNGREIYLMEVDGTDSIRLTQNEFDDAHPAWARGP